MTERQNSVKEIRDEYFDNDGILSSNSLKQLKKYLEDNNDENIKELRSAISLVTDAHLTTFFPLLGKHLDHKDEYIRELTVGSVIEGLRLTEYAGKGFEMAQNDVGSVRNIAIFTLGSIMDKVLFSLAQKIAKYLLSVFLNSAEDKSLRDSAYFSILKAMKVPWEDRPPVSREIKDSDTDLSIMSEFCKKYQIRSHARI